MKTMRSNEITQLNQYSKCADQMLSQFKQNSDSRSLTEKNRVQFLRSKGNDVFKVI